MHDDTEQNSWRWCVTVATIGGWEGGRGGGGLIYLFVHSFLLFI